VPVLAFAAAIPAAAEDPADEPRPGESSRDLDESFPGCGPADADGDEVFWSVRILDRWTGRPIPGATVRVSNHPRGGSTPADVYDLCVARADGHGWARLRWAAMVGWRDYVVVDAPGYAPHEYGDPGSESRSLRPGVDVPVVCLDYLGRPVPGALVSLNLGCGHIPDQRTTLTDADGKGLLRSIDPTRCAPSDIWVEAPGVHLGTHRLAAEWRPGDPPVPIHCPPGIVVEGEVRNAAGRAVPGARVGVRDSDRNWTLVDPSGRFRLVGVSPFTEIDVYADEYAEEAAAWFLAPPPGVRRLVRLGEPEPPHPAVVTVRGPGGEPAPGVEVVLVRVSDGWTAMGDSDANGGVAFGAPAGAYRVTADGVLGEFGKAAGSLEIRPGGAASLGLAVPRNPVVRVDARAVRDLRVAVVTAARWRLLEFDDATAADAQVPFPADEPCRIRVSGEAEGGDLFVRWFDPPPAGAAPREPLVLEGPPTTEIRARLLGPGGTAVEGRLRVSRTAGLDTGWIPPWEETPASDAPSIRTAWRGAVEWIAESEDEGLAPRTGVLRIPAEGGGPVDLGEVRLDAADPGAFRILAPPPPGDRGDGDAPPAFRVRFERRDDEIVVVPLPDGLVRERLPLLAPEESVVVEPLDRKDNLVPLRFSASAPRPWTVRWPDTEIRFLVRGADGEPAMYADALLDDPAVRCEGDETGITVRGLAPGRHRVVILDEDHLAKECLVIVREGDRRTRTVSLRERP
jgi:hypothetical protein